MLNDGSTNDASSSGPTKTSLVQVEGWSLVLADQDPEPRIRDLDLADRLGYERPVTIRDLIKRLISTGKLNDVHQLRIVRRWPGQVAPVPVTEYWLTEAQALKVAAKAETEPADALLDEMIRVFMLARSGRLGPAAAPPAVRPEAPRLEGTAGERAELLVRIVGLMSPAVSAQAKDVLLAHAAAMVSGQSVTPLLPRLPDGRWRRPSVMAREFGVSEQAVGVAITSLGWRQKEEHRMGILDQKRHAEGQVECSMWSQTVYEALKERFASKRTRAA